MMPVVLLVFAVVVAIIIYRNRADILAGPTRDYFGPVLGVAEKYEPCPLCGHEDSQLARGRGEVITRGGYYVVRQYHVCSNCNGRALWHRRLDQWVWTMNRNGVPAR